MRAASVRALLLAAQFVCPLLFFTDLTRNPYVTQIALLGAVLAAALAMSLVREGLGEGLSPGAWTLGATALDLPLAAWLAACAASWTLSYLGHAAFYRDSMRAEGARVFGFTLVNCLAAFVLAVRHAGPIAEEPSVPTGRWALFCAVWGGLWLFFPQLRSATPALAPIWAHVWDPFGALLWAGGFAAVLWLARPGGAHDYWHAALSVAFLSAAYGIAQYFSIEPLWPRILNPYGGRSVSTFGNPNFLSSYLVMTLPLAAVYYLTARTRLQRALYAAAFLTMEAGLLCTLTRSSWVGAAAALAPLALSRRLRRLARRDLEFTGLVACAALAVCLLWPQSNVAGYKATVLGRLTEMADVVHREAGAYSPWYQRTLIWACSWKMGAESPLLGNGWGVFELFYPFYQGVMLVRSPHLANLRTHANDSHNEVLEFWAQLGIVGVGILVWTWATFFRTAWGAARPLGPDPAPAAAEAGKGKARREPKEEPSDQERVWILAAAGGVLGMLADNLLNVSLHFAVPAFFFWWQVGTVMGDAGRPGERRVLRFPARGAAVAACAAVAAAASWGVWQSVRYWGREAHYFMGFKLMRGTDLHRAVEELDRAYRWQPREVNNNYELGNAYVRTNQLDKAVWAYDEALKANAGYDEIFFNRATVLRALGRRAEAERDYRASLAINPANHALYVGFAQFLMEGGAAQAGGAPVRPLLEQAVRFFPEDIQFLNNLGYAYGLAKEDGKAEEVYGRVLRLRPETAVAERNLRASLARSGHPEPDVIRDIQEFRKLEARLEAKVYDAESLRLAREAARRFPSSFVCRLYLANLLLVQGDAAGSEGLFRQALAAEPNSVPALLNLGEALKRLGRAPEAAEQFRHALSLEPGNELAKRELASLR